MQNGRCVSSSPPWFHDTFILFFPSLPHWTLCGEGRSSVLQYMLWTWLGIFMFISKKIWIILTPFLYPILGLRMLVSLLQSWRTAMTQLLISPIYHTTTWFHLRPIFWTKTVKWTSWWCLYLLWPSPPASFVFNIHAKATWQKTQKG